MDGWMFGELALVLNITATSLQSFFWVCSDIWFIRILLRSLLKKASIAQTKTILEEKKKRSRTGASSVHWNGSGEGGIHFSLKCAASWAAQSAIHVISREGRAKGNAPTAWSLTVEAPRRCSKRLHFLLVCNCELACVARNMLRVRRGFAWLPLTNEHIQTHQKLCLTFGLKTQQSS